MSIKFMDNDIRKVGGQVIFVPENCEYLSGKKLEIIGCTVYCSKEVESHIIKTLYGVLLSGGTLKIFDDSVCISDSTIYCSGDIEKFAKNLAAYCRRICNGKEFLIEG